MKEINPHSYKAFKYGILALALILILVILANFLKTINSDLAAIAPGILTIFIGFISLIGLAESLRGIKEQNTPKKIIAFIINATIVFLFFIVIFTNIYTLYKTFG